MNIHKVGNHTRSLLAAFLTTLLGASAQAGPGLHEAYMQVKTTKQAETIKPGERLAVSCGNCGVFTTFIADKDRSFLHGYTCETCKKKFVTHTSPHGGTVSHFVFEDEGGHESHLLRAH